MTRHVVIAAAFAAAGLMCIVPAAGAASATQDAGSQQRHLTLAIEGSKGAFKGDCASDPRKICPIAFHFGVHTPTSSATGQASGRRQYEPLVVSKLVGASSPQELQALVTNEILKSVTLEVGHTSPDGREMVVYRIKLTNAAIVSITQAAEPGADGKLAPVTENVSFAFQRIAEESLTGSTSASDDTRGR